jgi:methionyl-tRNA synthetase
VTVDSAIDRWIGTNPSASLRSTAVSSLFLTTPIYYVNDAPHIGHAYTTLIGDAAARWRRMCGDEVLYLTGTDEHGLKVAQTAEANGVTPQEWADRTVERFKDCWQLLGITNDDFIRTTEPRHYAAVAKLLNACRDAGDIYRGSYEGYYSVSDEEYITADEVDDYRARGRKVVEMAEENEFFRLSAFQDRLIDWYENHPDAITPITRRNEVLGFIKQGLQDFSISRTSLTWGIPIPWDPAHVTYVWFDALTNYLTAAGYGSDDEKFAATWPATHLVGKDIIRFHCVYWPAMLMSAGIEPPEKWVVNGWLLVGGEKMSKTSLNQIAPADLVADFGLDGFRYHLLADNPVGPDSDFTYEGMVTRYNADLANNLGNLVSRVTTVVHKGCGGIGTAPRTDSPLRSAAELAAQTASAAWSAIAPSEALSATWALLRATNAFLEQYEPWKMEPGSELDAVLGDALEVIRLAALLVSPAIPTTAQRIWERLGLVGPIDEQRVPDALAWGGYPAGLSVIKGDPLFPRRAKEKSATSA